MKKIHLLREPIIKRLPPLNALKTFEAAARRGSFHAASEELFVTPSAVSHQIKSLEDFLGLELFIRKPRKIVMTQAGEEYYQVIEKALVQIERATQELLSSHQLGTLHLSVAPAFLTRWLLPRISSFHSSHPDIKIEFSATTGLIDFEQEETDMAVYFGDGDWQGIEVHLLRRYQQRPVCSPKLLSDIDNLNPEDICNFTLLHVNKRRGEWAIWCHQQGLNFKEKKQGMYFSSGSLTTAAAINGLGFALADLGFVSDEISTGKLIAPLDHYLKTNRSFYLVYQKNRVLSQSMVAFQEWLMDEMARDVMSQANDQGELEP